MNTKPQLSDIEHFDQLSDHWWDNSNTFKVLHEINPLRLNFVKQHDSLKGKRVLDLGCGGGIFTEALAKAGCHVTGVDLAKNSIAVAIKHAQENKLEINYQCISVDNLIKNHEKTFDIICCFEMLEHVDKPTKIIKCIKQLLKNNGVFYASTLNRSLFSWFCSIFVAEKMLNWIPQGSHNVSKFIKPSELATMARQHQLDFSHSVGIIWNPLNQSFQLSDKHLEVNYICRFNNND